MSPAEKAALVAQYPEHWFVRLRWDGWEAIAAIPKHQRDEDHEHAAALYAGSTVTLGARKSA